MVVFIIVLVHGCQKRDIQVQHSIVPVPGLSSLQLPLVQDYLTPLLDACPAPRLHAYPRYPIYMPSCATLDITFIAPHPSAFCFSNYHLRLPAPHCPPQRAGAAPFTPQRFRVGWTVTHLHTCSYPIATFKCCGTPGCPLTQDRSDMDSYYGSVTLTNNPSLDTFKTVTSRYGPRVVRVARADYCPQHYTGRLPSHRYATRPILTVHHHSSLCAQHYPLVWHPTRWTPYHAFLYICYTL